MLKGLKEVAHVATHNNWHKSRNQKSSLGPGRHSRVFMATFQL